MSRKKNQDDHHQVDYGDHQERAKHVNAKPYKRKKFNHKNIKEDVYIDDSWERQRW